MLLFRQRGRAGSQNTVVISSFLCPPFPSGGLLLLFGLLLLSFLSTSFSNPLFPLFRSISTFSVKFFLLQAGFV